MSVAEENFALLIFAPIVETLLFQFGVIELLLLLRKNDRIYFSIACLISIVLFILSHGFRIEDILGVSAIGISLTYCYAFYRTKESRMKAFGLTSLLHFLYNVLSLMLSYFIP
ncbi:MAG: CPBP family intramembrane metalloprotease [Prevotella sp.]|nr:CPBP family intramembrane metalloprotease [Candidatus Equicola stercoris]